MILSSSLNQGKTFFTEQTVIGRKAEAKKKKNTGVKKQTGVDNREG